MLRDSFIPGNMTGSSGSMRSVQLSHGWLARSGIPNAPPAALPYGTWPHKPGNNRDRVVCALATTFDVFADTVDG